MVNQFAVISVRPETRERMYRLKGPGRTYDSVVSEAITLLEEKRINEHRSQSTKTSEAGTIVYPSNEERIN